MDDIPEKMTAENKEAIRYRGEVQKKSMVHKTISKDGAKVSVWES